MRTPEINTYLIDCMEFMADKPDNYYSLAPVDPPYGLDKSSTHGRGKLKNRIINKDNIHRWDTAPNNDYFKVYVFSCSYSSKYCFSYSESSLAWRTSVI